MRFARKIAIAMTVILFTVGTLQAQTITIEPKPSAEDRELDTPMWQMGSTFPAFGGDTSANFIDTLRVAGATGGDSSVVFHSWDFVGITYEAFSSGSVQFNLIIYIGEAFNTTTRMFTPFDTLSIDTTGVGYWDHNVPVSKHFMYALEGVAGTDATTRMYAMVSRRRYEEEVPEIDIFDELYHGPDSILSCAVNHTPWIDSKAWRKRLWDGRNDVTLTIK